MPNFRRFYSKGGSYFFTVVSYNRSPIFREITSVTLLQNCFESVNQSLPFSIDAIVILPDHLHTIWTLPDDAADYSLRWKKIKAIFSKFLKNKAPVDVPKSMISKNEKGIWQRRFWEHLIRDEEDFNRHCDYIHYNPVKHGLVKAPSEWKHSSFSEFVEQGFYTPDWGVSTKKELMEMNLE